MRSVGIVHAILRVGLGGSEARAMWAAEALKHDFSISILSPGKVDLPALNEFYGTNVDTDDVTIRSVEMPLGLSHLQAGDAIRGAFFARGARSIANDYDVILNAYNLCDFGVPAIQCVADFSWEEELRRRFDPAPEGMRGWFHREQQLRRLYLRLCRRIAPPSGRNLFSGEDAIIANSRWTARRLRERYGAHAEVIYPPVTGGCPDLAFRRRRDDFVCIGRISPEKQIERMIQVIGAIRNRGYDVRLRIIGPLDDSQYARKIAACARQHPEWVLLEGCRMGPEKMKIMAECRYGIHARHGEAFGIAVAEMVKAGCVTFVPVEGGQAEIVDHEALLYRNDCEAVEKIISVLNNHSLRETLIDHLRRQGEKFSAEHFMAGLRDAVERFIAFRAGASSSKEQLMSRP